MLIIDFEYACMNDPMYDVANFISETLKDEENIKAGLLAGGLTSEQVKTTYKGMRYQNLLNTHWAILMSQITKKPIFDVIAADQYERFCHPYPLQKGWADISPMF